MKNGTGNRALRKAMWWSAGLRVSGALVLALCAATGIRVAAPARLAMELAMIVPVLILATALAAAYRRHRRDGLRRHAALRAVAAAAVPLPVRKLTLHEVRLFTSTLRWLTRRRHGVRDGDVPVPYASGGAAVMFAFAYASAVETVVLAFIIPWPVVRQIALILDLWGVYFIVALYASCAVRPHVICADGSLRLRYGALLDIGIPARDIAAARVERRSARGKLAIADADGCAELSQGGQTTVTVQLERPVTFTRPLGKHARARTFRFYAADPAAAVAALSARVPGLAAPAAVPGLEPGRRGQRASRSPGAWASSRSAAAGRSHPGC